VPGSVTGTVLVQRPGHAELSPAADAVLELVASGQRATADADGNVQLRGLTAVDGTLRLGFDGNGDGVDDGVRLFDLRLLGAGLGHDVSLGQVVLGRLASVSGVAHRADVAGPSGHGGIQVFVPASAAATQTADDGSYLLAGLPEGAVPVTYFAPGHVPLINRVSLGSGQSSRLAEVALNLTQDTRVAAVEGTVRQADAPLAAVHVELTGALTPSVTTTTADGAWHLESPEGVANLLFTHEGFAPVRVRNVLLTAGAASRFDVTLVPGDADAGISERDAGTPPTRGPVRLISGVASSGAVTDGGVQVRPSTLAAAGDLLVLLMNRPDPRIPVSADTRGWNLEISTQIGTTLDNFLLLWRVADADEVQHPERYWFEASSGADWTLMVLRGASTLGVVQSREATAPFTFASAPATPGDLVLDAFISHDPGFTCQQADGGSDLVMYGSFKIGTLPVDATGLSPAIDLDCGYQLLGVVTQVRVFASP
jgi:hypothetical protein